MTVNVSARKLRCVVLDERRRPTGVIVYCDDLRELPGCSPHFKPGSSVLVSVEPNSRFVPGTSRPRDDWWQ